jgi:hypothetical protein
VAVNPMQEEKLEGARLSFDESRRRRDIDIQEPVSRISRLRVRIIIRRVGSRMERGKNSICDSGFSCCILMCLLKKERIWGTK